MSKQTQRTAEEEEKEKKKIMTQVVMPLPMILLILLAIVSPTIRNRMQVVERFSIYSSVRRSPRCGGADGDC